MRARLAAPLAAALLILLPSAAFAKTILVPPGGSISDAIATASAEDVIELAAATYSESPNVNKKVTIKGVGGDSKIAGTVTLAAAGAKLETLAVQAPTGGSAIHFNAPGTSATGIAAQRSAGAQPVVQVGTGVATLSKSYIVQGAADGVAGIVSAGGLKLEGTAVVSVKGPAVRITGATGNVFHGAMLATADPAANGVEVISAASGSTGEKKLIMDSTTVVGGKSAAGLLARTQRELELPSSAGSIAVVVRHSTVLGRNGFVADAAGTPSFLTPGTGNVSVKAASSIVHGPNVATPGAGLAPLTAPTTATVTLENSFTDDPYAMFRPGTYALRPDAAVIDKGGAVASDQYGSDVAGETRTADGDNDGVVAADIGADEFVNRPPSAVFGVTNSKPKQDEVVGFISGSTDPEAAFGGGIVQYRWDFGDGTRTSGPSGAVPHAYKAKGTYRVTLTTVDRQGATTTSSVTTVTVVDGVAPKLNVALPAAGQVLKLNRKPRKASRRRRSEPVGAAGTVADESVARVVVALTKSGSKCRQFTGRRFAAAPCEKLVWHEVSVVGTGWTFSTPRGVYVAPGRYQLRVRAMDAAGNISPEPKASNGTLVAFRVK